MLKKQGAESDYLNEDFKQVSTSVAFTSLKTSNQKKRPVAGADGPLNSVYAYATVSARWQIAAVLATFFS